MHPKGERLEPLGASDNQFDEIYPKSTCHKCVCLEDEKDLLQTSLFALTTHLAQIQFRLKQVVDAPFDDQEELLKNLEDFASGDVSFLSSDKTLVEEVMRRRNQQKVLIRKLKNQLTDLKEVDLPNVRKNLEEEFKTQIADLERFIVFLKSNKKCQCHDPKQRNTFFEIVDRAFSFLQIFTLVHFSGSNYFTKSRHNHWGDLRAKLEIAILDLKKLLHSKESPEKITLAVRKSLAVSIRDLMQHGLKSTNHSWDIILIYYHYKKGNEFNSSPFQKLSRSFNLTIAGVSPQKNLLSVIEEIISTHSRYKRSQDSHFKAFICAALNAKRLVAWLNLIFHCGDIIKNFYYPWSYVATTKYEDGLKSLDALSGYKFDLPVDLDVRKFQIEDSVFV